MRVRDLAAARSGDKGSTLDLTLVAFDDEGYAVLERHVTGDVVQGWLSPTVEGPVVRHLLPGLRALKYVAPEALAGGVFASLHAGVHWQKAAIWLLLDRDLPDE
jgi:hypothetical protein